MSPGSWREDAAEYLEQAAAALRDPSQTLVEAVRPLGSAVVALAAGLDRATQDLQAVLEHVDASPKTQAASRLGARIEDTLRGLGVAP